MFDFFQACQLLQDQPAYRLKQVKKVVFQDLASDWQQATNLPQELRSQLHQVCPLTITAQVFQDNDRDAGKALFALADGAKVEAVLMKHADQRRTVCVSSQVGCPLDCQFCATAKIGFQRNLIAAEIINQVLFFSRLLRKQSQSVTNIVFMGMGEPLLNTANVFLAIKTLHDPDGLNLGFRHFSISTAGIIPGLEKLARELPQVNLAVSLHSADNQLRSRLMPINKKYPLSRLMPAIDAYINQTKRRVMLEYLLMAGINDSPLDAAKLAKLAKRRLCFINLLVYNPTGDFQSSSPKKIRQFKEVLTQHRVPFTQRYRFGQEIKAGCGQLAAVN